MIRNSRRMVTLAVAGAVAIAPVITGCGAGEEPQSASPTQLTDGVNVSVPLDKPAAPQIALRNMFVLGPRPGQPIAPGLSLPLYGVMINQVKGRPDRLVSVSSPQFGGPAQIDGGGIALPGAAADGTGALVKLLGKPTATPSPTPPSRKKQKGQPGGAATGRPSGQPTGTPTASGTPGTPGATPEPTGPGSTSEPTASPTGNTAPPQQTVPPAPGGGDQPLVVLPSLRQELLAGSTVLVRMQFEKAGGVDFQVPIIPQQDDFATFPLPTPAGQAPGSATPGAPQTPGSGSPSPTASTEPGQPGTSASPTASESPGAGH
ncbi:hypothetical protein [Actinomadura decatromicini]|uniref:Copper chaperone PCu(A)C n=1 Tax=Actinomadura decatromicini TaxID=2604572 RepID=A0A5D3F656_9ACTN|nr:hypothetical protein [Actinomadura decatromicini]TYK43801.1 hypothetical protein FXF68_37345 [Actinomadura decatromicini]